MSVPTEDPMAGITSKTTRSELLERLKRATSTLRGMQDKEADRLSAIEQRVREKWQGRSTETIYSIVISGTRSELEEGLTFLDDFEDIAPATLKRLHVGMRTLFNKEG